VNRSFAFLVLLIASSAAAAVPVIHLPAKATLRFIVTGDAGSTHSRLRAGLLKVIRNTEVDAILLTGDNFYPCGVSSVHDPQWSKITEHFGPTHLPVYAVLGNHDYGDQQQHGGPDYWSCGHPNAGAEVDATGKISEWHMPARNYLLRSAVADFVMIDTQPVALDFPEGYGGSLGAAAEKSWIAEELPQIDSRWRIVLGHHTIYSSGMHGRTNDATQRRVRELLPLMLRSHVDLYICGHDHDMELLGDLHRGPQSEPLFLVSGAGSGTDEIRPRHANLKEPPTLYPPFPAKATVGFAVLEVDAHTLTITFFDETGKRIGGPFVTTKN
jgi:acid phosphatase